jgi:hypothetical protein
VVESKDDKMNIGKLNEMYTKAESVDSELYSEMRSNCLLVAGKHYNKSATKLWNRFRSTTVDKDTKLRLVKNHVFRIVRTYLNELLRHAPGVRPFPSNDNELQDEKAAELANSVWQHAKDKYNINSKVRQWASNYIDLGECAVKIFWDPTKGRFIGYEQELDENNQPLFTDPSGKDSLTPQSIDNLTGQVVENKPKASQRAVFSGDFVFETIFGFNLLRDPRAESIEDSEYLINRKMVDQDKAKALCGGDEDKLKFVGESGKNTFKVFDGTKGEYIDGKGQVMLREYFFRPCQKYPKGYYFLTTEQGILHEMELPFGVFPIAWAGFEEIPTSPRAHSIIRVLRPYQGEINRAASGIATAQVTLGDDKLVTQAGAKVTQGAGLPGVRQISVSGAPPTILPGRSGEQYFAYLQAQISEMYQVANIEEMKQEVNGQLDANVLLFRSMRQKQRFSIYATKFEHFLKQVCSIYLRLAQKYLPDEEMIRIVGRPEHVNIQEFKTIDDMSYAIRLEPITEDLESMLGKSLQIQQVLQYVGKDLPSESRGEMIAAMPFLNKEKLFSSLTIDAKNADSDILSLDRGQYVQARKGEKHDYVISRLYARQKMRDYDLLPDQVKQMYEQKIKEHSDMKAEELAQLKQLEMEFIPMKGALIGIDQFVVVPNAHGGNKTVRARIPSDAAQWLIDKLEQQGQMQQQLANMPQAGVAGLVDPLHQQTGQMQQPGMPQLENNQGSSQQFLSQQGAPQVS